MTSQEQDIRFYVADDVAETDERTYSVSYEPAEEIELDGEE